MPHNGNQSSLPNPPKNLTQSFHLPDDALHGILIKLAYLL